MITFALCEKAQQLVSIRRTSAKTNAMQTWNEDDIKRNQRLMLSHAAEKSNTMDAMKADICMTQSNHKTTNWKKNEKLMKSEKIEKKIQVLDRFAAIKITCVESS